MSNSHFAEPIPVLAKLRLMLLKTLNVQDGGGDFSVKRGLLDLYRRNPTQGKMTHGIFSVNEDWVLGESNLPALETALTSLDDLERWPLPDFSFCSVIWEGKPCGVLVEKDELKGGGLLFVATLFFISDEEMKISRAEFRAAKSQPEPFASLMTITDWMRYSISEVGNEPIASFLFRCIAGLHSCQFRRMKASDLKKADVSLIAPPRENDFLLNLCKNAYAGKVVCTRAIVPMELIIPDDMEHALEFPLDEVKRFMPAHIDNGQAVTELLLYQSDGKFIMGDDYVGYLTYKALLFKKVPAVILGDFSSTEVEILERGGSELIPPIMVTKGLTESRSRGSDNMQKLQERLASLGPSKPTIAGEFSRIYLEFCHLLRRRRKREADIHNFLKRYPVMIDGHAAKVHSEVRVGNYRADLIFQYEQSDKRILLIELEMDNVPIFTKKNRLREGVDHASQQIEDWIQAIRTNAPQMPEWLKGEYVVEGMVVIGRSAKLTDTQKKTLFTINSNRLVKVITYDDLLERFGRLIGSFDQVEI